MKRIIFILAIALLIMGCASTQNVATTQAEIEQKINEQRYTFVAQSVVPTEDSRFNPRLMFPQGNNLYQLTSRYDLKVTPDSVTAYLPFFGRAFTAPLDPTKGGIQFTSTKFTYKKNIRKNNFHITILPQDVSEIQSIYLTISPSGYGSVQITSTNRTPISYHGIIETP
ncbi:DUF4251 domain-containing protein [Niabella digestorum]|uniref:DUF4251 domain-containing protein n=1 Tax=Niabella digestorum TaxID=3117701 RepID=A0ABU7RFY4_9BACT